MMASIKPKLFICVLLSMFFFNAKKRKIKSPPVTNHVDNYKWKLQQVPKMNISVISKNIFNYELILHQCRGGINKYVFKYFFQDNLYFVDKTKILSLRY